MPNNPPNFENRTLFHGDNLAFLRAMNSGSVHLIATDPPFNKGRDFHATPDSLAAGAKFQDRWSWDDDVEGEWVDQITDDWPHVMNVINGSKDSYGEDMGAFLCFMAVRLLEMRRVLRDDGSIYLHCDPTASHYLKELMDAIFGKRNFRNEIVWDYSFRLMHLPRFFNRKHDVLLFYARGRENAFQMPTTPWTREDIVRTRKQRIHIGDDGEEYIWMPGGKGHSKNKLRKLSDIMQDGKAISDVWPMPIITSSSRERMGYPTQKPLALYERIIQASSEEGGIVLDPFCGCATTPIAAERLGRQWVGMDLWDGALEIVQQRMEDSRQLLTDIPAIHYETTPPVRTDGGGEAAPFIQVTERYAEPEGPRMSRAQMYEHLLAQYGQRCQGCDRTFDDPRYLELDHNTPRSDGGWNHITNRVLLCSPCNRLKAHRFTLSGLREQNRKLGYMAK